MSVKPTIALVPGSFSTTAAYDKLIEQLSEHGYPTLRIELKSVGGTVPATSHDDAAHIHSTLSPLVEEGKEIVVIMHSYGGVPGTDGTKGLAKVDQSATGKSGGVIALVYIAALMIRQGASLAETRGETGSLPDWVTFDGAFMSLDSKVAVRETLSDMPGEEADKWAHIFEKHSAASFGTELQYAAYKYIPSWYILAENDKIVEPELQQRMVDRAREDNDTPIKLVKLTSGHAPIISQTEKVVDVIREAAGEQI
jgi:pimeloyl-ACP methyl ester carboxylesterase